ncbi:hypothetical protein BCR32DRAFT_202910, partial [Anaeromyces robustus]
DIDGTLLNSKGQITEKTNIVIHKILEKYPDIHFVLASGRSRPATKHICETLHMVNRPNTEALLCNGSILYDSIGNILWQQTLSAEYIIKFHNLIKKEIPNVDIFYSVGDDLITFNEEWARKLNEEYDEQTVVVNEKEFIEKIINNELKVNKTCILKEEGPELEKIKKLFEDLKKEYNLEQTFAVPYFLEYMPHQTNKGTCLAELMKILNVSKDEVLSFGDSGNDIEHLQTSGWPVAMANATEEIKSIAKLITKSNDEDGVASMLEKIFLNKEN